MTSAFPATPAHCLNGGSGVTHEIFSVDLTGVRGDSLVL